VLSHWLLGIHRIRMDSAVPLAWDLGWLAAFGLLPAAIGWWLLRGARDAPDGTGAPARRPSRTAALAWTGVALAAGLAAARPPPVAAGENAITTVVLRSRAAAPRLLAALGPEARIVGADRAGVVWQLRLGDAGDARRLWRAGALWVADGTGGFGCAARTTATVASR
jgi:hypothetical protein